MWASGLKLRWNNAELEIFGRSESKFIPSFQLYTICIAKETRFNRLPEEFIILAT